MKKLNCTTSWNWGAFSVAAVDTAPVELRNAYPLWYFARVTPFHGGCIKRAQVQSATNDVVKKIN